MLWLDGALQEPGTARIDPADRGFLLGDGVFETVRAAGGVAPHLPRHLARLRQGAAVLGIPLGWTEPAMAAAAAAVLQAGGFDDAALRITLSRGPGPRGVLPAAPSRPTLLITATALPPPAGPVRLIIARSTCRNEASPLSRIKSLNYLDSIVARREAAAAGADDAILLGTRGRVAEASAATLFLCLSDGTLVTPPVADGALPGLFRARLLEAGRVVERSLPPDALLQAPAALLGNSLGVRLVAAIDGHPFEPNCAAAQRLWSLASLL